MNFREMRGRLIASYGRFVFFPGDPEVPKIVSTKAFTHLVMDEDITLYAPKLMEEQVEEELKEGYDVVYGEPSFEGEYLVSPGAKVGGINFKFSNGEEVLRKAMRKPFPEEVEIIKSLSEKILKALERFWGEIRIGMRESEMKSLLDSLLLSEGVEQFSYPTIVVSGRRSRFPVPTTGDSKVEEGSLIYIDSFPSIMGYTLNFSRVIFTEERREWIEALERINSMYQHLSSRVEPGMSCNSLDSIIRAIGEMPHYTAVPSAGFYQPLAPGDCVLEEDMVFTIVPSIYLDDGVVRVKRNLLVRKRGVEFLV